MYEYFIIVFMTSAAVIGDYFSDYSSFCKVDKGLLLMDGQLIQVNIDDLGNNTLSMNLWPCQPKGPIDPVLISDPNQVLSNERVKKIQIYDVNWSLGTRFSYLQEINLNNVTLSAPWGVCTHLENINMNLVKLGFDGPWLSNCSKLKYMMLMWTDITYLPNILKQAPNMEWLDLVGTYLDKSIMFKPLFSTNNMPHPKINTISLQDNVISSDTAPTGIESAEISAYLVWQLSLLPQLQHLLIAGFKNFDFCAPSNYSHVTFPALYRFTMSRTNTTSLCFHKLRSAPLLQEIIIKSDHIEEIKFGEFFSISVPTLRIDYRGTDTAVLKFTRSDYMALTDGSWDDMRGNVILKISPWLRVECDCSHLFWFSRAIDEQLLQIIADSINCSNGEDLDNSTCEWPMCDGYSVPCDSPCICCREKDAIMADCHKANLPDLPANLLGLGNLGALNISNNSVTFLPDYLPVNLHVLNLSKNKISNLTDMAVSSLFNNNRRIWFSGNPVDCSCYNLKLLEGLQNHVSQIEDYENITCGNDGRKLSNVDIKEICLANNLETKLVLEREEAKNREITLAVVIGITAVFAVTVILLAIAMNYRNQLKIFLFARGWCLCCIREEELDANRRYDVFLSFCHQDQELVLNEFLPKLDQEYSVCLHLRDWYPGEMIPNQIAASVDQSRRTIVVLSKAFLKSIWGLLEFRTAYMCSLQEGRVRLIMIVLDDVLEGGNLAVEVRSYIRYNTYVHWGDPWFWEKVRYALPHRLNPKTTPIPVPQHLDHSLYAPPPSLQLSDNRTEDYREVELENLQVIEIEQSSRIHGDNNTFIN